MSGGFIIEPLSLSHDRKSFSCGAPALDRYLKEQVGQDVRRRAAVCYVAHEPEASHIAGYYTLSAGDVPLQDMPEAIAKRLPRYPVIPVARLGRLAIDRAFQGRKLGAALLWDAANRALRSEMGVVALAVDAEDVQAEAFYRHHGFVVLGGDAMRLVLPLATAAKSG